MLKIGIVGSGNISKSHWAAYQLQKELCEVVAICDISDRALETFQSKHSVSLSTYNNIEDMLEKEDLDCVSICTPPFEHKKNAITAMEAGVHVFCEKPMAASVQECDEMISVQKRIGMFLGVSHQNRFRNDIQEVKYVLDSGILGKTIFSRIDSFWWRSKLYYDLWWRGLWSKEAGGCLLNHAIHQVDLTLWILGEPKEISSYCDNLAHDNSEVEDFATAIVRFENGSVLQFTTSVACHGEDQQLYFQCEKGKLVSPWDIYCSNPTPNGFFSGRDQDLEAEVHKIRSEYKPLEYEKHNGAIYNFLNAVSGKEELLVTGEDGKKSIEFITSCYQIHFDKSTFSPIRVDKNHPWYTYDGILKNAKHFNEKTRSVQHLEGEIIVGGANT